MTEESMIQLAEEIEKKARSYVPEWRFTAENPDIGSALALVYARMMSGLVKKLQGIPYKNQIAFFNMLDAQRLAAVPAVGFVSFCLADGETQGEEVPAGTSVLAPAQSAQEETLSFETLDDIYVTPAQPDCLLQVSAQKDFIGVSALSDLQGGVYLFGCHGENLQRHRLYFCHDDALSITREGRITVDFWLRGQAVEESFAQMMADPSMAEFSYSCEDGYRPFASVERNGSRLVFVTGKQEPPFALRNEGGRESFWICCEMKKLEPSDRFRADLIQLASGCGRHAPDCIYADGTEVTKDAFFPFGEQFSDYNEVYFLADEVLRKKGAVVTLSFNLDFVKIPLDFEKTQIQWEWIMHRSDFKTDMEFDVTIEETVWEYFNGYGWTSLFEDNSYHDLFSAKNKKPGRFEKISFVCPGDLSRILVGAQEGLYIRARILKANNLYKQKGYYISPVLDHVQVQYDYAQSPVSPQQILIENNCTKQLYQPAQGALKPLFFGIPKEQEALYLGFEQAPYGGPVKMLFEFFRRLEPESRTLYWEYSAGRKSWRELDLADETENMSRTGIVTMMGSEDFEKRMLFGLEKYWIRIQNVTAAKLEEKEEIPLPCLCGFYMNTVRIRQKGRMQEEYFHMDIYEENKHYPLLSGGIISCRLWVDETGSLSREEMKELEKQGRLFIEYRQDAEPERVWAEWTRTGDFLSSKSSDRHYLLDSHAGVIRFGNGREGRIPPASRKDSIRVLYETGGGEQGNVKKGAVNQPGGEPGRIQSLFNPKALTGGSDAEPLKAALRRNAALLRHQNMAVTQRDYEQIALEASRSLKRVKCFCGLDDLERKKSGAVTLVLLQKDFRHAHARFYDVKAEVESYMKDKIYTFTAQRGAFYCIPPRFVEICVRIEAVAERFDEVFRIKKQMRERLEQFLNPLSGGFDQTGWEIGTMPDSLQIRNALSSIPGVRSIRDVYMSGFLGGQNGRTEADLEALRKSRYILPVSGKHEIMIRIN